MRNPFLFIPMNCFTILILLITATMIHSCCESDCESSDYTASIRILGKPDSTDLFFGHDAIYQVDKTKYYGIDGGDTIYLTHDTLVYHLDTVLFVDFGRDINMAYIQYEDGDIDTFHMLKRTNHSDCCGTSTRIEQIGFNDGPLIDNGFPFVTFYK